MANVVALARSTHMVQMSSCSFKAVGGDNQAEAQVRVAKHFLRRHNKLGRNSVNKVHVDVMAAAFLARRPGLASLLEALEVFREHRAGGVAPRLTFDDISFLGLECRLADSCPSSPSNAADG